MLQLKDSETDWPIEIGTTFTIVAPRCDRGLFEAA